MLMRWRPLVCSIARFSWLGAQQPAGRAAWVGCTASANNTASLSAKEFNEFLGGQRSRIVRGRGTSNPCRAARRLLGAEPREARDRANERASADQHSRRDRSGDRPNPDDRGSDHRRRLDDEAAGSDRGVLANVGAHPCFSGQCALSSRQARAGMARPARAPDQTALYPNLLPALEPDRAVMGLSL